MSWNRLPTGPLGAAANLPGIDANLVWADASGWRDFLRPGQKALERIPVIAEIEPASASAFAASISNPGSIPPVYRSDGTTHCTARLTAADCRRLLRAWAKGSPLRRLELQAPLIPQRPRLPAKRKDVAPGTAATGKAQGSLLIGVIDYGCPFAHRHLREATKGGTRILNLWLQDETHPAGTLALGATPSELGYGLVLSRSALDQLIRRHRAINDGCVDEEACYAEAGMNELRQRFLHGAAVLDLLVGPRPFAARTSENPDRSPTWDSANDEAGRADIVFVQLPRDLVQDSTSAGLARCILDGVKYILSCAGETTRVVVNISDGSSRGSHDGNSVIERALSSLVAEQAERDRQVALVFPAGNSRDEERHAQFDKLPPREWCSLRLRLPPGCEAPSQLIIRIPAAISDAEIRVAPPGQDPDRRRRDIVRWGQAKAWPDIDRPACAVVFPAPGTMATTEVLVTWAPTERFGDGARAPAGDWEISVRSRSGSSEAVHFYIARNQINPHALFRGRQAFFLDEGGYDPDRHLRARDSDPNPPQSPIRRRGSLNSLATSPSGNGMVVVGSTFLRERTRTAYSSEGPAAGGEPLRSGPDTCAPTDISHALRGIAASGTMTGQVVRVTGTSFAAPQVARALANDQWAGWLVPVRQGKAPAAKRARSRRV